MIRGVAKESQIVSHFLLMVTLIAIFLPYIGPDILGIGVKPIWLILVLVLSVRRSHVAPVRLFIFLIFLMLDISAFLILQVENMYGWALWSLMLAFTISDDFFTKLLRQQKTLISLMIGLGVLFISMYSVNYLAPELHIKLIEVLTGQVKLEGRTDFAFLAPEPGQSAFSILLIAYVWFFVSSHASKWHCLLPCIAFMVMGSATGIGLGMLWVVFYLLNTTGKLDKLFWVLLGAIGFVLFFYFTTQHLISTRFLALLYFDINGDSSVSIRARDIARLAESSAYLSAQWEGPVGFVKAVNFAPSFALLYLCTLFYYCKPSDFILILPAIVFLPLTHPFVWVVIGLRRYSMSIVTKINYTKTQDVGRWPHGSS